MTAKKASLACSHRTLEPRVIRDEFDYGPDDDRVKIVIEAVQVLACAACGEIFYGPEAEHAQQLGIRKAYHLLLPEEIKAVREQLGKTQEEFAELTGIGVATLSRWERGRLIQTRTLDNYLRILRAVPEALDLLQRPAGDSGSALAG